MRVSFHRLLGNRTVIAPDLNGYVARSDMPVDKINIWGQIERVYEVIQAEYQGAAVSLVDHSVGVGSQGKIDVLLQKIL